MSERETHRKIEIRREDIASPVLLRDVTEADLPLFFEHQREPEALRVAALLRAFLSQSDLTFEIGTSKWLDALHSVLERSGILVILATDEACQSEWVLHEVEELSKSDRLILPLRLGEPVLPERLAEYQVLPWDGSTASPAALQEILRLILGGLARVRAREAAAPAREPSPRPSPGRRG